MAESTALSLDLPGSMRTTSRWGWALLACTGMALIVFVTIGMIEGAVVSGGMVKVDLNRKQIQHQEGGIVHAVRVRDGQKVKAGEVLIELADVAVNASVGLLGNQRDAELARTARLEAEKSMAPRVTVPESLRKRMTDPEVRELVSREQTLFTARRGSLDSQLDALDRQIIEVRSESAALQRQLDSERRAVVLQREELHLNEDLVAQNYLDKPRLITLKRAVEDYETRIASHEADQARAAQKLNELQIKRLSLRNDYVETAARDQRESTNKLLDVEQRLLPAEDAARRQRIVAPVDGEVVGLKVTSPGTVIGPRDVLMEIVPQTADLIVEGRIRPEDVTRVRRNAMVDVKLTAFSHGDSSVVTGTVDYLSADVFTDQANGARFYTVQVRVGPEALKKAGEVYLQAGMPAEIYIKTHRRTIAEYLFEPVTAYLWRAMREN
jgi:membrane fusion protein, epimerase transport system